MEGYEIPKIKLSQRTNSEGITTKKIILCFYWQAGKCIWHRDLGRFSLPGTGYPVNMLFLHKLWNKDDENKILPTS